MPLRTVLFLIASVAAGAPLYVALDSAGIIGPALRATPWPFELLAAALLVAARPRRVRDGAAALVAIAALSGFSLWTRAVRYRLPPAASTLPVGVRPALPALRDASGRPWSLEAQRGHPIVLLLIRGVT